MRRVLCEQHEIFEWSVSVAGLFLDLSCAGLAAALCLTRIALLTRAVDERLLRFVSLAASLPAQTHLPSTQNLTNPRP